VISENGFLLILLIPPLIRVIRVPLRCDYSQRSPQIQLTRRSKSGICVQAMRVGAELSNPCIAPK
jgi:hypothetical protein